MRIGKSSDEWQQAENYTTAEQTESEVQKMESTPEDEFAQSNQSIEDIKERVEKQLYPFYSQINSELKSHLEGYEDESTQNGRDGRKSAIEKIIERKRKEQEDEE
ncbi:hypothetical protein [Natrarchaeobaculum aegyptiacum]|uniref:Uncharacterized protein n=1 Tax=Natrarchaeobaculum aegyptiacum TaxID=745377 RepID=A0A2Z2HU83_9EURY|nr:hypothetical protein [Natrarchaeobaculum aegyptiacum]ARS90789.1 hypothetical protein B1756_14375 [Natrarchaeobaculum aegyptiacum]